MRPLLPALITPLLLLHGCALFPDPEDAAIDIPSLESSMSKVSAFEDAAFGEPWSVAAGQTDGASAGAAYLPAGPRYLIHHDPVALEAPTPTLAINTPDFHAWQLYCSGRLLAGDHRLARLLVSTVPASLKDTCLVAP